MPVRNGRSGMSIGETRLDERALLMPPPPPVAGDLSPPTSVAAAPTRYAPVHLALALLHARHVHAGDEVRQPHHPKPHRRCIWRGEGIGGLPGLSPGPLLAPRAERIPGGVSRVCGVALHGKRQSTHRVHLR